MTCTKQKDAEPFKDWNLTLVGDPASGSAVLSAYQQGVKVRDYSLLRALADVITIRGEKITNKTWRDSANLDGGRFERPKASLVREGLVEQIGEGRSKLYTISKEGWDLLEQQNMLNSNFRPLPDTIKEQQQFPEDK